MGRLNRSLLAVALASTAWLAATPATAAFDGFGEMRAESTYGEEIRFEVDLAGDLPSGVELQIRTPGADGWFVIPASTRGSMAVHSWDTSTSYVTPNTPITYRWRADDGDGTSTVSDEATIRYRDDRSGLDWQSARLGEATVHWYGDAEAQARRFGELTALGVARAEELLGTRLAGPVDVFVYATRDDFFGALGPGAREWTGAAAFSELRTIFMWLGGGSAAYLERAMVHEVTHIVFHDATDNPFHDPARWLNEGIATWAEADTAAAERAIVEIEAAGAGLFAFEAIADQFPIGERGGRLSYAQGTTLIDMIIDRYGETAIARIAAAYREGASDSEALEAGTGVPASELYGWFFEAFGVEQPTPIEPEPILLSNVDRPPAGSIDTGGAARSPGPRPEPSPEPAPGEPEGPSDTDAGLIALLGLVAAGAVGAAFAVSRRAARREVG